MGRGNGRGGRAHRGARRGLWGLRGLAMAKGP